MMDEMTLAIAAIIERRDDEPSINAAWVANEAMQKFDPRRLSHPAIYGYANEHAKQVARGLLRKRFDPADDDNIQHELFTGLQQRYPIARTCGGEPSYVKLDYALMKKGDSEYNIQRFRNASSALAKHADALETWEYLRPKLAVNG